MVEILDLEGYFDLIIGGDSGFGHLAGCARLKQQICFHWVERKENFSYKLEVFQPLNFEELENNNANKTKITKELNNWLEKAVQKNPGQWILTHNRWK